MVFKDPKDGDPIGKSQLIMLTQLGKSIYDMPVVWHPTTPTHFKCERGCICCGFPFYTDREFDKLPTHLTNRVHINKRGFHSPFPLEDAGDGSGTCCFFDMDSAFNYHCTIHEHSPLFCKIFPYYPVIDMERHEIVVLCNEWVDYDGKGFNDRANRCFGLDKGSDIRKKYDPWLREYLYNLSDRRHLPYFAGHCRLNRTIIDKMISQEQLEHSKRDPIKTFAHFFIKNILPRS